MDNTKIDSRSNALHSYVAEECLIDALLAQQPSDVDVVPLKSLLLEIIFALVLHKLAL